MSCGERTIRRVAARSELDATYKVAVRYTVDHIFYQEAGVGEQLYDVTVTAKLVVPKDGET